ncbi:MULTISPECIES: hypothetical protein [Nitrosomonas]|uniref:hypothetical protein n=1 Tax=Nitrosomonas TaxID=914 RepID=UPI00079C0A2B|nr:MULTISPECIES: hypothetical protein [Nitrosomonas]KXK35414.1 MAG: hypothetical protein UZ02_AOB001002575 [Nitrosomonas europaea]QOJ09467.1 MAG: hypothetical protein HRU73_08410 [Nitrosomonas sp. H1_AOB3]HRN82312.1 hypothetical protein [Nitrosomonas europaea]HRO56459.1 hypothetical protein [Nitrosomonas europaea]HRQ08921.1 hypothetical protein [Nitrosomonas europaea]
MNTSKSIKIAIFSLSAALVILIYAALSKSIEISQLNREVAELQEKLVSSQETEKEVRVVAAFFKGATNGISDTEPKAIETASKVVSYVIQLKNPAEVEFRDCWEREESINSWGSMGPFGLLDACIAKVKSTKSAVLLREIDAAVQISREECAKDGKDNYDMARNCWADRTYRFIFSANQLLFSALTEPESIYSSNPSID